LIFIFHVLYIWNNTVRVKTVPFGSFRWFRNKLLTLEVSWICLFELKYVFRIN
jgi:hypothetical protein